MNKPILNNLNLTFIFIIVLIATLTVIFIDYTQDDVFITYTYSRNISEGNGFVFNLNEQLQGTTTPLWTLVMAGVYRVTDNLLTAGNVLSGMLLLFTLILCVKLLHNIVSRPAIILLCLALASLPLFYVSFGMETLLYCTLLMAALTLWRYDHRRWAIVCAGFLVWTRADGMVLAGVFGLILLWDAVIQRRLQAWREFMVSAVLGLAIITPWFGFAWFYFGSLTPNTFSAKAEAFSGILFLQDGWFFLTTLYGNFPLSLFIFPALMVGLFVSLKNSALRPLGLWVIVYASGYTILNTTEFWYYTPLFAGIYVLIFVGIDALIQKITQATSVKMAYGLLTLWVCAALVMGVNQAFQLSKPPQRTVVYREFGRWINQNTPTDSTLLLADLGIVGYHARRHAVDSFGLIVSDMYSTTPTYAALKYRPDYAVTTAHSPWYETLNKQWFHRVYRAIFQIPVPEDVQFSPSGIYERRVALETPLEVYQGDLLGLNCLVSAPEKTTLPSSISAQLSTFEGEVLFTKNQRLMFGQYPNKDRQAMGNETIKEQIIFETGGLPAGRYTWSINCHSEQRSGQVDILPFDTAIDYVPIMDAAWRDGIRLTGVRRVGGGDVFSGGAVRLLLGIEGSDFAEAYQFGIELINIEGQKQAEGIFSPPQLSESLVNPAIQVVYGEVNLPVVLLNGLYRVEINRFLTPSFTRVPFETDTEVYSLPISFEINDWKPVTFVE